MSYVGNPTGSMIGSSEPPTGRIISSPSAPGTPGKSAYELAVQAGFEGTLEEWLDSLEGSDGASTWNDISGKPSTFPPNTHTHSMAQVTGLEAKLNSKPDTASLADVALSGSYNDLSDTPSSSGPVDWDDIENRPDIPTELTDLDTEVTGEELDALKDTVESLVVSGGNIQSDWDATSGPSVILNKPTLGSAALTDSTAYATATQGTKADTAYSVANILADFLEPLEEELGYLAGVTSPIQGQLDDLAEEIEGLEGGGSGGPVEWGDIEDKPEFATVATSGSYDDLEDLPDLSNYAPSEHFHNISDVDGLGSALAAKLDQTAVDARVAVGTAALVDSAPSTLDTLNELAAALGDDPEFATTVATQIGLKADKTTTINGKALSANVTLTQDDVADGSTAKQFTATEKSKLSGIASGATANDTDANLKNRANHTGTQSVSTITGLASVATSGDYSDLSGKPTIPSTLAALDTTVTGSQLNSLKTKVDGIASGAEVNVNADWNASSGDAQILNKPTIPNELTDLDTEVTGDELDALKSTVDSLVISGGNIQSDWDATTGPAVILNKPDLATVATSGSYNDLTDKPSGGGDGGFDWTLMKLLGGV